MIRRSALLIVLSFALPAAAQTGLTGNWSGSYTYTALCKSQTFTTHGTITASLLQTGGYLSARIDLSDTLQFSSSCGTTHVESTGTAIGTVSGTDVTLAFANDSAGTVLDGPLSGNTMTLQLANDAGGTGTFTLTRVAADAPAVDVTGTWSGNYSLTDTCSGGTKNSYSGAFTFGLTQLGNKAGGVATMKVVPLYDNNCKTLTTIDMMMTVAGTVSGSTFKGSIFDPSGTFDFPVQIAVSNGAMSVTASGASSTNTAGQFSLNQTSSQPPASDFTGSYEGSYDQADDARFRCFNVGVVTFSGPALLSIVQAGNAVSGWIDLQQSFTVVSDGSGGCAVLSSGNDILPVWGTLSGNSVTLTLPVGGGVVEQFIVNFANGSATGSAADNAGDTAQFQVSRTATSAAPAVDVFSAASSTIVKGQSTTLTWSASDATSVSIDNGIGTQPASGSVKVTPSTTTTYMLTANGPGGTATATTKVTVVPIPVRRREAAK